LRRGAGLQAGISAALTAPSARADLKVGATTGKTARPSRLWG